MEDLRESMGVLGLMNPFTSSDLVRRMKLSGAGDADAAQVKLLWEAYQDAVLEKKLKPFLKDAEWIPTFNDLVKVTGLPKMTVSAFLTSLREQAVHKGTNQYLDPSNGQALRQEAKDLVKEIVSAPGKIFREAARPVVATAADAGKALSGPLMWVAIGAAAIAVIYVGVQLTPMLAAKPARKKKG